MRFAQYCRAAIACTLLIGVTLTLPGCKRSDAPPPPPRATDKIEAPQENSTIAVPLEADVSLLGTALERSVPRTLWSIDQRIERCVAQQRVKVFGARVAVTPKLGCRVVGTVTRGAIRLHGEGNEIVADLPIRAVISARDIGGVIKRETGTGSAMAQARIRLTVDRNWNPHAVIRLRYNWTSPPGIDILGQRITFTDRADARLQPIVRQLERTLPAELAKINLRRKVDEAWRQGFATFELNSSNPPVWMRVTPQRLSYGGYDLSGRTLRFRLGLEALTETFVGPRPAAVAPTPLPAMTALNGQSRLRFFVPVIADYAELEPVVMRALTKRSARPFVLPGIGPVTARFESAVVYGTDGGRIAVGITLAAKPTNGTMEETRGLVWVTAEPFNQPNSQVVEFRDLRVAGKTNGIGGDLLLQLANSPAFSATMSESLTQNFAKDFGELMEKVRRAIIDQRQGRFVIRTQIDSVESGSLKAAGEGLYLPVWANGSARIEYRPGAR